jgi:hypothetical protein
MFHALRDETVKHFPLCEISHETKWDTLNKIITLQRVASVSYETHVKQR